MTTTTTQQLQEPEYTPRVFSTSEELLNSTSSNNHSENHYENSMQSCHLRSGNDYNKDESFCVSPEYLGNDKMLNFKNKKKRNGFIHTKKGALTDIFIFIIISVILILVSGMFIYMSARVNTELHENMDSMSHDDVNYTAIIDQSMGKVDTTYQSLYWISVFLMVGMMLSILIGSYIVTTRPVFFVPYILLVGIALIVSVGISNAYMTIVETPELKTTFDGFLGANYIMYYLPIWVAFIGFTGGIIMFVRMKQEEYIPAY